MWSSQIKGRIELLKTAFLGGEGAGKINEKKIILIILTMLF